jgi:putative methionine-R-sulfoxide reductase with GAF domain
MGLLDTVSEAATAQAALDAIADAFGAVSATLHRADAAARVLTVVAHRGVPPPVLEKTRIIPYGKGMAGICAERGEIVEVCNLQAEDSGVARPSARETGAAGAIVVPIVGEDGGLEGTLGVGRPNASAYSPEERALLTSCARALSGRL